MKSKINGYNVRYIPHQEHRNADEYETPGDYWIDEDGVLQVRVSLMGNQILQEAVALHEMTEASACLRDGVTIKEIEAWDAAWDTHPDRGKYNEPGDHPDAPYHVQHVRALALERHFVESHDMDWEEHDKLVLSYSQ